MKSKTPLKTLGWIAASVALSSGFSSAAVIFSDDLSEANGTVLAGKLPDTGLAWQQTSGTGLSVQGNAIETQGGARIGFANFSRSTTATEITTVTLSNLATSGNFFSSGFAGYSLSLGGVEQIYFGDLGSSTFWGIQQSGTATTSVSTNNTIVNTATLVYNAVTGVASLSLSSPGTGNPVATLNVGAGKTFNSLRFANGSTGDLKFGTISVDAVPEPSGAMLSVLGLASAAFIRRRKE